MTGPAALRVWGLQGKTTGDNAQVMALGESLAERFGWEMHGKTIGPGLRDAAKRMLPRQPDVETFAASGMAPPWPDVVIACGGTPSVIAHWIRSLSRDRESRAIHVQIGRLRTPAAAIDLILETAQYGLPASDNTMFLTLPIVRGDAARQQSAMAAWQPRLVELPRPWLAVLVGGPASPIRFAEPEAEQLLARILTLHNTLGGAALVAYGPRTPDAVKAILAAGLAPLEKQHRIFDWPPPKLLPDDPNPYPALLGSADRFLVSCDSASMLADACVTGKPVEIFMLPIPKSIRRYSRRGLGLSLDVRRRRRQRTGETADWLDLWRDFLVRNRLLRPYRDMRDFLHGLTKTGVVENLGRAETGRGKDVQRNELQRVQDRIFALRQAVTRPESKR